MRIKGYARMRTKKGNAQVPGQMAFQFCTDTTNYIVQSNALIFAKQDLKINSLKVIRMLIMQITPTDDDFKTYIIPIKTLSSMLEISASNLYRDIDKITDDILQHPVEIKDDNTEEFIKIPWVSACSYKTGIGLLIKINPLLKPYLINLREHYTQYEAQYILKMKSGFGIRIFELLIANAMYTKKGTHINVPISVIRDMCNCNDTFPKIVNFKKKVLDAACQEINKHTYYSVTYNCIRTGRSYTHVDFYFQFCLPTPALNQSEEKS